MGNRAERVDRLQHASRVGEQRRRAKIKRNRSVATAKLKAEQEAEGTTDKGVQDRWEKHRAIRRRRHLLAESVLADVRQHFDNPSFPLSVRL